MLPLTEDEIRASFVNCSRTAARRIKVPETLDGTSWDELDYLGWFDPRAPLAGHLVVPTARHGLVGLALRAAPASGQRRAKMCSLCHTVHGGSGVGLLVAPRAGKSGRDGNTVGLDICADLACSAYVRGLRPLPAMSLAHETLSTPQRVERLRRNLDAFVGRVLRNVRD
jgi:hypothetical protein